MAEEVEQLTSVQNNEESWLKLCCIKDLVPTKLCYFFQYGFLGAVWPYITIYFFKLGLTVSQAGYINGLRTIFPFFLSPLFGMLADITDRKRLILQIFVTLKITVVFIAPWLFAPFAVQASKHSNLTQATVGTNITFSNRTIKIEPSQEPFPYSLFFIVFSWGSLAATVAFPLVAFIDQSVIAVVKKHEKRSSYGFQRIFAPIGFTIGSFLSGVAIDLYAQDPYITKYNAIFYCCFPFGVLLLTSVTLLPMAAQEVKAKKKKSFFKNDVIKIFRNIEFNFFLMTVIILGIGYALINGFLLFLLVEIHTPKSVIGMIVGAASFSEVMIYPFSSKIKIFIGGSYPCFITAVFSFCLRFLLFSFINNYWLAIPIQLLHSIGFALFWIAAVEYTNEAAPKNNAATVFNIVISLYYCFAGVISNVGGGVLYQHVGGRFFFQIMGIVSGIWGMTLLLFYLIHRRGPKKKTHQSEECVSFT